MKLVKVIYNKRNDNDIEHFIIYDETSKMYYMDRTWTFNKYKATIFDKYESDRKIEEINVLYRKIIRGEI
ncbi:MAG: hypothetical protein Q8O92_16225 [Candidatus Latescibacter sp.]|nr:hypothetical protein [Candidatus Latescibacter sp.]